MSLLPTTCQQWHGDLSGSDSQRWLSRIHSRLLKSCHSISQQVVWEWAGNFVHLIALGVVSERDYITMAPCLIVPCRVGSLVRSAVFRTPSLTKPKDSVNYMWATYLCLKPCSNIGVPCRVFCATYFTSGKTRQGKAVHGIFFRPRQWSFLTIALLDLGSM